jgi:predicted nucleotidyltransferase
MFEQERFVGRLQRHVLAEQDVVSCFLTGSFGRRGDDLYSDVDVVLVYEDGSTRDAAWAGRATFVKSVMPYVPVRFFDAGHVRPYFVVALYSNGTKVDYLFQTKGDILPSDTQREVRILKDTGRWAEQFQAEAARYSLPLPYLSAAELTELDDRFWVMVWDVMRQLKRGDTDKPFTVYLQLLSFTLPPLLNVLPPEEPARRPLVRALYSSDAPATMRALTELLDAYVAARAAVVRRGNLVFTPNTGFESELRRLIDRLSR